MEDSKVLIQKMEELIQVQKEMLRNHVEVADLSKEALKRQRRMSKSLPLIIVGMISVPYLLSYLIRVLAH